MVSPYLQRSLSNAGKDAYVDENNDNLYIISGEMSAQLKSPAKVPNRQPQSRKSLSRVVISTQNKFMRL